MSRPLQWFLIVAAMTLPLAVLAEPVACPPTLDAGAVRVVRYPSGWEPVPAQLVRLSSGGLMRGHPQDEGYLRGDEVRGGRASVSRFAPGEEKWLWCGYSGGAIQIAKRLPNAATVCTVSYTLNRNEVTAITAACR